MLEGNTKGAILVVTYERWHTTTYIGVSANTRADDLMKVITIIWVLVVCSYVVQGQTHQLKPTKYGLDMMLRDIPKEQLISDIRFEDGIDDTVGVVRFDHVGPNLYPLIISSKLAVPTDSLGLLSFKMQPDSLFKFLWTIDNVNPKFQTRDVDEILIRVTYRFKGEVKLYYMKNFKITTGYFWIIEQSLKSYQDKDALEKFYKFLARTGLFKSEYGVRKWKYL